MFPEKRFWRAVISSACDIGLMPRHSKQTCVPLVSPSTLIRKVTMTWVPLSSLRFAEVFIAVLNGLNLMKLLYPDAFHIVYRSLTTNPTSMIHGL